MKRNRNSLNNLGYRELKDVPCMYTISEKSLNLAHLVIPSCLISCRHLKVIPPSLEAYCCYALIYLNSEFGINLENVSFLCTEIPL